MSGAENSPKNQEGADGSPYLDIEAFDGSRKFGVYQRRRTGLIFASRLANDTTVLWVLSCPGTTALLLVQVAGHNFVLNLVRKLGIRITPGSTGTPE